MPTIEVSEKELLQVVKRMAPQEFEAFLEQVLALHSPPKAATLSVEETKLIQRINCGLPAEFHKRHAQLTGRRKKGILTTEEHQELFDLTRQAKSQDVDRASALLELAKLRRLPVRMLMKQMGIQPPPIGQPASDIGDG